MAKHSDGAPPRPLAPGDIVTTYSDLLDEWVVAQITGLDATGRTAAVLQLTWSGPEPRSVADLGQLTPLRLTHHGWRGALCHRNVPWVLPRSHRVIGTMPLLHAEPSRSWAGQWDRGEDLAHQRQWDAGDREEREDPHALECAGVELDDVLGGAVRPQVRRLRVTGIRTLDCDLLVAKLPGLTTVFLAGDMGTLTSASSLGRLSSLRSLHLVELFGMDGADCVLPRHVPELEFLVLYGIPAGYAAAMRAAWRPEIPNGTYVDISRARTPEWVAENLDNPLRDWDGRGHISAARYKKAVAQYRATRKAVLTAVADGPDAERLDRIGRDYGTAFNRIDGRDHIIETIEREELFEAVRHLVAEAETALGQDLAWARTAMENGIEAVRDW